MDTTPYALIDSLGPFTWPLFGLALITGLLLLERLVTLTVNAWSDRLQKGVAHVLAHYGEAEREAALHLWLSEQYQRLTRGLKTVHIVALAAPLVGLLGTVLGLMQSFSTLASQQGAIHPAQLADGLSFAMGTTVAGLAIALPALCGYHALKHWAGQQIQQASHTAGWQLVNRQRAGDLVAGKYHGKSESVSHPHQEIASQ